MRLTAIPVTLCLTLAAHVSAAKAADDVIINGLHCNQYCQAWLGVGSRSGDQAADAAPAARHEVSPPVDAPRRPQHSAVAVASLYAPSSREPVVEVAPPPTPAIANPARHAPYRTVVVPTVQPIRPRAVSVAVREVAPASIKAPSPRLTPEPAARIAPLVPAPSTRVRAEPTPKPADASYSEPFVGERQQPVVQPSPEREPSQQRQASYEVGEPVSPSQDIRAEPAQRAVRHVPQAHSSIRMEPGLTTLPRLDDVVAVHGTIMIETAEDKALAKKQMADLIKATTRPKQFKTGFIGQPSTEENAAKLANGSQE